MEQLGPISAPDLTGIHEEALAWTRRDGFDRAMAVFCEEMVAFHSGRQVANLGMGHTLIWAIAALIVYFDQARPEGVTFTEIAHLCEAGGLGGRKAAKSAIDALRSGGLVTALPRPEDRRARRLRPTQKLLDLEHDNIVGRLKALELTQPLPGRAEELGRGPRALHAFLGGNVEAFVHARFRLYDGFSEVQAFMDRSCGYMILLDLLRRAHAGEDDLAMTEASPSDLSARFDISRAHVRKLLTRAHERGWIAAELETGRIRLDPGFHRRMRHWIGVEFVWMWRLVAPSF